MAIDDENGEVQVVTSNVVSRGNGGATSMGHPDKNCNWIDSNST